MAGFITFDISCSDKTWSSANWVFAGYLDHVIEMVVDEADVVSELVVCRHHQIVDLKEIEQSKPAIFDQITDALQKACGLIAEGNLRVSVDGDELDSESQRQYRQAIEELSQFLAESNARNSAE